MRKCDDGGDMRLRSAQRGVQIGAGLTDRLPALDNFGMYRSSLVVTDCDQDLKQYSQTTAIDKPKTVASLCFADSSER